MKLKKPRFSVKHPKRVIIIVSITLVVLAVATYSVMSILNWNSFQKRTGEASVALKTKINDTLGFDQASGTSVELMDAVITDFEKKNGTNPCVSTPLYNWQSVLPVIKDMQTTCEKDLANARSVISSMKDLRAFLDEQDAVVGYVYGASNATLDQTDYTTGAAAWKKLAESKLPQSASAAPINTVIIASAEKIETAYTHLSEANKAEDRAAFDTASDELTDAYKTLADISAAEKVAYTRILSAFMAAYETL